LLAKEATLEIYGWYYFQSKHRKVIMHFARSTLWLIFDKFFLGIVSFVVIVKVANTYGSEAFGLYQYAFSIFVILNILTLFVDDKVVKGLFHLHEPLHVLLASVFGKIILYIPIIIIFYFITTLHLDYLVSSKLLFSFIIAGLLNSIALPGALYFDYSLVSRYTVFASLAANSIVATLQYTLASLYFPIEFLGYVIVLGAIVKTLIIWLILFRHGIKAKPNLNFKMLQVILKKSSTLALAAGAALIYTKTDLIMIANILNAKEAGVYAVSLQFFAAFTIIVGPFQSTIYRLMSDWFNSDRDIYEQKYKMITTLISWSYIIFITFLIFFVGEIIDMLFDQEYQKAKNLIYIHMLSIFLVYNAILRSVHFALVESGSVLLIIQLFSIPINIGLNYILISKIGLEGAAIATFITLFISLFLSNRFFEKSSFVFRMQISSIDPRSILLAIKSLRR